MQQNWHSSYSKTIKEIDLRTYDFKQLLIWVENHENNCLELCDLDERVNAVVKITASSAVNFQTVRAGFHIPRWISSQSTGAEQYFRADRGNFLIKYEAPAAIRV